MGRGPKADYKTYAQITAELHGIAAQGTVHKWMHEDFPRIAARMSHGVLDTRRPDAARDEELGALRAARAQVDGLAAQVRFLNPDHRWEIVEALEVLVKQLREEPVDEFDEPLAGQIRK